MGWEALERLMPLGAVVCRRSIHAASFAMRALLLVRGALEGREREAVDEAGGEVGAYWGWSVPPDVVEVLTDSPSKWTRGLPT